MISGWGFCQIQMNQLRSKAMHVVRIPGWLNFDFSEASYYGYRWGVCIGPVLIFLFSNSK